jgi:ABC-2 type transport system permease protein
LTRSQVIAVILGAVILVVLLLLWTVAKKAQPPLSDFLSGLSLHHVNFRGFQFGILELRGVAYYLVMTYFFLLCATKVLEARRWR